ncbi:MFS transporter, partial [Candidatus Woesearchaeota archaeon]|nr:MFS transporter [Candidatus Woesearchaeota archaeon]
MAKNLTLNNIKKFYVFSFLRELLFIVPVIVIFWQENGLSLTKIMILQALYTLSIALFEVPTGVFADKIGRKHSLAIGAFVLFIAAVVYSFGHNFWQFVIAEVIWGLGVTFTSGADSAFVYDTLKQSKKENDFKKIWGNSKSVEYFAAGTAAILGGFIATYSLRLNWVLVAVVMLLLFFVSLSFHEPKHYKKLKQKNYWSHTIE